MAFTYISVLEADYAHAEECSGDDVIVPYLLSDTPPEEWKSYFEKQAPASANAKIVGNTALHKCLNDKAAIRRYGACWKMVADLIEDANRYYSGVELRRYQELGRQAETQRQ
jgi:hypothetical protein